MPRPDYCTDDCEQGDQSSPTGVSSSDPKDEEAWNYTKPSKFNRGDCGDEKGENIDRLSGSAVSNHAKDDAA